jgi:hypothetical protein
MFGIKTYYRKSNQSGDSNITVKMEGVVDDLPVFEQCAVIHEVDLFHQWIPFCCESVNISKIGNAELVAYVPHPHPHFLSLSLSLERELALAHSNNLTLCARYLNFFVAGISRDMLLRAYGADGLSEHRKILVLANSIDQPPPLLALETPGPGPVPVPVPWKGVGWFHNRLLVKEFRLILDLLSPTSAKVTGPSPLSPLFFFPPFSFSNTL